MGIWILNAGMLNTTGAGSLSSHLRVPDIKLLYVCIKCVGLTVGLLLCIYFYFMHFKLLEFGLWNWIIICSYFVFILYVYFYFKYFKLLKFGLSNWITICAYFKHFMILDFFI